MAVHARFAEAGTPSAACTYELRCERRAEGAAGGPPGLAFELQGAALASAGQVDPPHTMNDLSRCLASASASGVLCLHNEARRLPVADPRDVWITGMGLRLWPWRLPMDGPLIGALSGR
jgi:hypothetical protein